MGPKGDSLLIILVACDSADLIPHKFEFLNFNCHPGHIPLSNKVLPPSGFLSIEFLIFGVKHCKMQNIGDYLLFCFSFLFYLLFFEW